MKDDLINVLPRASTADVNRERDIADSGAVEASYASFPSRVTFGDSSGLASLGTLQTQGTKQAENSGNTGDLSKKRLSIESRASLASRGSQKISIGTCSAERLSSSSGSSKRLVDKSNSWTSSKLKSSTWSATSEQKLQHSDGDSSSLGLKAALPLKLTGHATPSALSHAMPRVDEGRASAEMEAWRSRSSKASNQRKTRWHARLWPYSGVIFYMSLRLSAIASPWVTFIVLCFDQGCEVQSRVMAGVSAFVVLVFGLFAELPAYLRPRPARLGLRRLAEEIIQFSEQTCREIIDLNKLIASATHEEYSALCVLTKLNRCWSVEHHPNQWSGARLETPCASSVDLSDESARKRPDCLTPNTTREYMSEMSVTSAADFNRQQRLKGDGRQVSLELDLPSTLDASRRRLSKLMFHRPQSHAGSDDAMTYHSACEAVLGDGSDQGELISADVVGLGKGPQGMNRVRIEFRSQCLRTQNEWQRSLLAQQRSLLNAVSTQLENTKEELTKVKVWADDMHDDQRMLLRAFRKIVTREIGDVDEMDDVMQQVVVIVIDEEEHLRIEAQQICADLEYRCFAFGDVYEANKKLQSLMERPTFCKNPSWNPRPIVLLGAQFLNRFPPHWEARGVFVALTSVTENFEDVGRVLLASGEAEIREKLREMGIHEYLFHPLSMNAIRGTVLDMLRSKLGDEYLLVDTIGRGRFGVVYRARRLRDGEVFALKEISRRRLNQLPQPEIRMELDTLKSIAWPTVVTLIDAWLSSKERVQYLLMPLLAGGNVSEQIQSAVRNTLSLDAHLVSGWYAQTLHAVTYLHWRGVLHRDIKPANLFLSSDITILQVGDFGSAATLPGLASLRAGSCVMGAVTTAAYAAPEVYLHTLYYTASDMWSIGVAFYETLVLELPHSIPEAALANSSLVRPSELGAKAESVLRSLAESSAADQNLIADLMSLISADPFSRPAAIVLTKRPHVKRCLEEILVFPESQSRDLHFEEFHELLSETKQFPRRFEL